MLTSILSFSLRNRFAVIVTSFLLLGYSLYTLAQAKYDVFPEFAPPQVIIQTEAPGFSSDQVETLVTQAVEQAISGVTGVISVRSTSIQGLSAVQVFFDSNSDILQDRQMISERIANLSAKLPAGLRPPAMTPLSSTTNIVLGIGLTSDTLSLTELRSIATWFIRPRLLSVAGVADAEAYGGLIRQIQVQVNPKKMIQYGLNFDDINAAAGLATGIRGAGVIDTPDQRITLLSSIETPTLQSIAATPLTRGVGEAMDLSITLGDVAAVKEGTETPFSAASIMGNKGVLLIVTSQYGANTPQVTNDVENALAELAPQLEKLHVTVRSDIIRPANFIEVAISNVNKSLLIGAALVSSVLFIFLVNWRGAIISALSIPFSLVISAALLSKLGYTLNIMTLGGLAIAVGLVVDDAVIDVENMLRRMRGDPQSNTDTRRRYHLLLSAGLEVRSPVIFATLAVVLISIPIMTVPGLAGRFFAPLGVSYALSTLISLLVALTVTPALCMSFLKETRQRDPIIMRLLQRGYMWLVRGLNNYPIFAAVLVIGPLVFCINGAASLKSEFLPELHEGHLILHMELSAGASLDRSIERGNEVTRTLLKLPFIGAVVQQVGRAEGGIDIWGANISEFNISLKTDAKIDEKKAVGQINEALRQFPDAEFEVAAFLTERIDEVISGYTRDAALYLYGNDLDELDKTAARLVETIKKVPGVTDINQPADAASPMLKITLNEKALNKWGLTPVSVLEAIHTAYQGNVISQIYDAGHAVNVSVIIDPSLRANPDDVIQLPVRSPSGMYVPLKDLAQISAQTGRYMILREGGRRVQTIVFNLNGPDKQAVLQEVKSEIAKQQLPLGYYISIASLSDEAVKSRNDLIIHGLFAFAAILVLLSVVMKHPSQLMLIVINAPLAVMGGMAAILLNEGDLSLGAMVGFITLLGITLRNSVLLLSHYTYVITHEGKEWNLNTAIQASAERLMPILMTSIVTGIGLLPIALNSNEPGREIEGPMAMVILGGLITSTVLNLLVMPVLAYRFGAFGREEAVEQIATIKTAPTKPGFIA